MLSVAAHRVGVLRVGGGVMIELVRQWLLGVTCTALVLAAVNGLAPEGSAKKVCRLAGGLALLVAAVGPVLQMKGGNLSKMVLEYQVTVQDYENELEEKNVLLYQSIIEEAAAAYIVDKAEEVGILCQAEVTFSCGEDGIPYPWEVTAWGVWTEEHRGWLSRLVEDDLGVPEQRQHYEEIQP